MPLSTVTTGSYPSSRDALSLATVISEANRAAANGVRGGSRPGRASVQAAVDADPMSRAIHPGIDREGKFTPAVAA